jgi:uncharacterized protein YggU (UPF0235/DUF167 family)
MKNCIGIPLLILVACAEFTCLKPATAKEPQASVQKQPAKNPALEELLAQLKKTLLQTQVSLQEGQLPPLKDVQITLQTELKITGGAKVELYVISLGETVSRDRTQSIKLTLTVPEAAAAKVAGVSDWSQQLAQAIISVATTVAESSNTPPKLALSCVSATIKFVTTYDTSGGGKVTLLPITVSLEGSITPTNTQEAVLTFGQGCEGSKKEASGELHK